MSRYMRHYLEEVEINAQKAGYSEQELNASELRKSFIKKYILDFDTNLYTTQVERDWAYICRREYRYDVELRSIGYGFFTANLLWSLRMFMLKKFVFWPVPIVTFAAYQYFKPVFFQRHNKKFFDMCNVGEEYFLGAERLKVLRECNQILDREDF